MLLLSENITATHNKHAWETGKPKNVEIGTNLDMRKLALKSICATFSPVTKPQTNVLLVLTNVLFLKANILEGSLNILFPVVYMNRMKLRFNITNIHHTNQETLPSNSFLCH